MREVYLLWHCRPTDKQAWPVVYQSKELAEACKFRVGPVLPVVMPPLPEGQREQNQRVRGEDPQHRPDQGGPEQE